MTCCVAVSHGSKIFLAGDSRVACDDGSFHESYVPKVWKKRVGKHWVGFGFSGEGCYHAPMVYELNPPPQRQGELIGAWLFGIFERAMEIYASTPHGPRTPPKHPSADDDGWQLLCCFRGHISYFDSCGEFDVIKAPFAAIGCASMAAEGYHVGSSETGSELATSSVGAACRTNLFCGEPIITVEV
jgi:hypothetical protein